MGKIKDFVSKHETLKVMTKPLYRLLYRSSDFSSQKYWENRYQSGGNSGAGSYGRLAEFKAKYLNEFVKEHKVKRVIEFGCGDGNQLGMFKFPEYIGLDVSKKSIEMCKDAYGKDEDKSFFIYDQDCFVDNLGVFTSDLSMSLDVIYHLVEDEVFEGYMNSLFASSNKYVIIYASNKDDQKDYQSQHVRHRKFTDWVEKNITGWELDNVVKNEFPLETNEFDESFADFFIYKKSK